ncbi:MAG TPA: PAS domain-containing protein, partial [Caulobacteraceae bacterium]|nr:PAS domain-containing protein [Caulobacteraceae bacterium]
MGRFYFHIRGPDGLEPDQLGLEFESADQAYFEACRAIPKLATDLLEHGRDPLTSAFEISDAHGRVVMEVPFGEGLNRSWRLRRSGGRTRSGPRSRTAAALLAEQVYRAGFEGSPSAYVVLTPDLRILGANASFLKLTHTSRERVMGRNAFEAFPDNP